MLKLEYIFHFHFATKMCILKNFYMFIKDTEIF